MFSMAIALFVGRFQPFHRGHMLAIREILGKNDKVVIVIGSAQQSKTPPNPFSVGERAEMIKNSLEAVGIEDFEITPLRDFNDDRLWTSTIKRTCKFDVAYSCNPWTLRCLEKNGAKVKRHRLYQARKFSGAEIRKRILLGRDWKDLVPPEVHGYLKKIKGDERIRKLGESPSF